MLNPDDIKLIAATLDPERKLDWLWRCCPKPHSTVLGEGSKLVWAEAASWVDCTFCHGIGKVPHIDRGNIIEVEAWYWNHWAEYSIQMPWGQPSPHHVEALDANLGKDRTNVPARVEESIRIIAEAIRASKGNET